MASEAVLKELFQVAKNSKQFAGMSDDDIWGACVAYKERPDEDIQKAMENIRKKDWQEQEEIDLKQKKLEAGKDKMIELRQQEKTDHEKDEQNAEEVLKELFNS